MEDVKKIEVLKKVLNLSEIEAKIVLELLSRNGLDSKELSKRLNVDVSYIRKALKKLLRRKIIDRYQKNLVKGRSYLYFVSKDKLKKRIRREFRNFSKYVFDFLNSL